MLYEFKCEECGEEFEEVRPLKKNTDASVCPKCNKKAKKIMSIFGFKIIGFAAINGYSHANK